MRFLSMTPRADGFRDEGGAGAEKTLAGRSGLRAPVVSLGVATDADRHDLLENEHGHGHSFRMKVGGMSRLRGSS